MPAPLSGVHLSAALYGDPVHLGTIAATTSATNGTTAAPFHAADGTERLTGKLLVLQPDVACYVRQVATAAETVTAANGFLLSGGGTVYMSMRSSKGFLAVLPVSGTVNLKVFEMNG
jgi:hypothetical protein